MAAGATEGGAETIAAAPPRVDRFLGKTSALSGHVYHVGASFNQSETFQKTTREIAEYLGRLFDDEELRTAVLNLKMTTLVKPQAPEDADTNRVAFEEWKSDLSDFKRKLEDRKKHGSRAYAIIYGQCSYAVRKIIESHDSWHAVNTNSDFIGLLKLIQHDRILVKSVQSRPDRLSHSVSRISRCGRMADGSCLMTHRILPWPTLVELSKAGE
eukprot:CAMPEP_0170207240 /NCGR_PEP_ID=MMETSP0116_2-20130129/3197_1 /TAXON_ID=400756 /ORGANISM="Durinskia baltica, Strain CSIRO CS-38" /LENGTH=212 /DNA_ID=CAMNT_0010457697 /DNA_START=175 /DNA_END=812 /DNA_ORIENTATION=+